MQNFIAQKKDLILLTPSGDGIILGIKLVNDAQVPLIEVNNKAGFGRKEVNVLTYVGAGRRPSSAGLQGKLLDQAFGVEEGKGRIRNGLRRHLSANIARERMWMSSVPRIRNTRK